MLRAQQYQVINQANIAMIGLRNQEIQYFNQFFTSFGTQSAVIGGFMVAALAQTPGLDPMHQKNGMIYSYIYWICTMLAISTGLYCIVGSLYVTVFGSGLALRGPVGSMVKAVNGMVQEQHIMILTFSFTLLFANISLMGIYFIQMEIHLAIICSIINLLGLYLWYDSCIRIYNRFQFIGDFKTNKIGGDGLSSKHRVFPSSGNQDNQKWFDDDEDNDNHHHHHKRDHSDDRNSLTVPLLSSTTINNNNNMTKPPPNPLFSRLFPSSSSNSNASGSTGGVNTAGSMFNRSTNSATSITNRVTQQNLIRGVPGGNKTNSTTTASTTAISIVCKGYLTVKETRKRFLPAFLSSATSSSSTTDATAYWSRKYVVMTPDVVTNTYTTMNYYIDEDQYLKQPLIPENKRPIVFDQDYVFQEVNDDDDDDLIGFILFVPSNDTSRQLTQSQIPTIQSHNDNDGNDDSEDEADDEKDTTANSSNDFSFFNRSSRRHPTTTNTNTTTTTTKQLDGVGKAIKSSNKSSSSSSSSSSSFIKKSWQFRCDTIQQLSYWKQAFLHLPLAADTAAMTNSSTVISASASATRSWPVTIRDGGDDGDVGRFSNAVGNGDMAAGTTAYVRNRGDMSAAANVDKEGWRSHG